jgi:hypothetical protein
MIWWRKRDFTKSCTRCSLEINAETGANVAIFVG